MPKATDDHTTNSRALTPITSNAVSNPTRRAAFTLTGAAALFGLAGPMLPKSTLR